MVWNFTLYLLYGLAFFTLGVAILSRDIKLSELGIARIIWLLALFGIIHGFHEWLELLEQLHPEIRTAPFALLRLTVVSISFLFLLYFGLFINIITVYGDKALMATPKAVKVFVAMAALGLLFAAVWLDYDSGADTNTRMMVAFPGGLLAGVGLMIYSRTVRNFSRTSALSFILAGAFMVCYSFLTGLVSSDVVVTVFGVGVKVILFRGLSAFLIMFFTIRALSVFSLEQRELINDRLLRFSQSEKLSSMGILAAGIAHEINNPLTNVSLNVEMLRDQLGTNDRALKKLEAIERNAGRASRIAKELLQFSRENEAALEATDLNEVIMSTRNLLKNQKLSSIIRLNLGDIPSIQGIPWKLEEVFVNLLLNSIDACGEHDLIEVETCVDNGSVVVTVSDTGAGISDENLTKIFDPFFTTKEIGRGTGLGLSVCYNIIKQHGGKISVISSEHGGAVVNISFPVMPDDV